MSPYIHEYHTVFKELYQKLRSDKQNIYTLFENKVCALRKKIHVTWIHYDLNIYNSQHIISKHTGIDDSKFGGGVLRTKIMVVDIFIA